MVANYRNALSYPERLFISRFSANFSIENGLTNLTQKTLLESQTRGFVDFVLRMQKSVTQEH